MLAMKVTQLTFGSLSMDDEILLFAPVVSASSWDGRRHATVMTAHGFCLTNSVADWSNRLSNFQRSPSWPGHQQDMSCFAMTDSATALSKKRPSVQYQVASPYQYFAECSIYFVAHPVHHHPRSQYPSFGRRRYSVASVRLSGKHVVPESHHHRVSRPWRRYFSNCVVRAVLVRCEVTCLRFVRN
jgi:hypothetical protein